MQIVDFFSKFLLFYTVSSIEGETPFDTITIAGRTKRPFN
jgi:hypothetical protein